MTGEMTLAQIRTAARQRSDMVNSQFVTDDELNSYINQSYFELYDLLVQKYGADYYVSAHITITTTGLTDLYPLPNGTLYSAAPPIYKLLGLDLSLSGDPSSFITIPPFMFAERNRYAVPNMQSFYGLTNLRYRLQGNNVWFTPQPAGGQTIRMWYVPRLTPLTSDASLVDGVSGWTEYIIVDAAIKAMQKEESDVSVLMAQKQALIARIEAAAENRDAGNPQVVSDTQAQNYSGGGNGWGWGNGRF